MYVWIHQQIGVEVKVVDKITQGEHVDREEKVVDRTPGTSSRNDNILDDLVSAHRLDNLSL